jgi:hypothetical protein
MAQAMDRITEAASRAGLKDKLQLGLILTQDAMDKGKPRHYFREEP